jgi:hypothetical protein
MIETLSNTYSSPVVFKSPPTERQHNPFIRHFVASDPGWTLETSQNHGPHSQQEEVQWYSKED